MILWNELGQVLRQHDVAVLVVVVEVLVRVVDLFGRHSVKKSSTFKQCFDETK
jgi:hypothetical protein